MNLTKMAKDDNVSINVQLLKFYYMKSCVSSIIVVALFIGFICFLVNSCENTEEQMGTTEIVSISDGVYILGNGCEVWQKGDETFLLDGSMKYTMFYSYHSLDEFVLWERAEVGQKVDITRVKHDWLLFLHSEEWRYKPQKLPDYEVKKVVKKISKFDGHMSRLDGKWVYTPLGGGSGSIEGESAGSEKFYINVWFDDGKCVPMNAKENSLWLDVVAGDTVLVQRKNGLVKYYPKPSGN